MLHARRPGTRGQHAHLLHHRPYRRGDSVHHVDHAVAGPDHLDDSRVVHFPPGIVMLATCRSVDQGLSHFHMIAILFN
jgi:hypothetical protein